MEKTKFGLSASIMGALVFFLAQFGGFTPLLLVAGYILIAEDSVQLKKHAVTALAILLCASAATYAVNLLPSLIELLFSFLRIFKVDVYFTLFNRIVEFLDGSIYFTRGALLVLLGILTLLKKNINIPLVDKFFA